MSSSVSSHSAAAAGRSDPADLGVLEASELLRARHLSSAELTDACLRRIAARNGGEPTFNGAADAVNAWARLYPDHAREQARAADRRLALDRDSVASLCGIPVALKDLYAVQGLPLTASSRVLEGNVANSDCVVSERLREHGMVLLGHTHTHEFAAGGTTDQVGNPWALDRVVGGSSGGSAAALAARMVPAATGTDTCGSLRIPSACCGTSTIKPTHGLIPIDGIVPLAPSLDHAGPMARTIADCAALLAVMAAGRSQTTPLMPPALPIGELPLSARPGPRPLADLTVALTSRVDAIALDQPVATALDVARDACCALGARVLELPAPWELDGDDLSAVLLSEAWAYHARHTRRHDRYRPAIAEFVDAASGFTDVRVYLRAQGRRARGLHLWEEWFRAHRVDVVLEPTVPIVPCERGPGYDEGRAGGAGDPLIALTALWDMTGMPVASLPVSWDASVSLIAPRGREAALIQTAIDLQEHVLGVPSVIHFG
jgi:aspartyl-tRNA(Asn)/glutamyl-tRNA(Gln) amidotransferase subunit A